MGWAVVVPWVWVAGGAAGVGAVASVAGRGRVPAGAGEAAAAAGLLPRLQRLACAVAVFVLAPAA